MIEFAAVRQKALANSFLFLLVSTFPPIPPIPAIPTSYDYLLLPILTYIHMYVYY